MEAVILLGGPGTGKGTAATMLADRGAFTHVSTGEILREALASGSAVGEQARVFMDEGELVPDNLIVTLIRELLLGKGATKIRFILDGFPRNLRQGRLLDELLENLQARLTTVILLETPEKTMVSRILGRLTCGHCGAVFHVQNMPPKQENVCDACGSALCRRTDDTRETLLHRLEVFHEQTEELIDYYEQRGVLVRVDAGGTSEETHQAILRGLAETGLS